jgi:hypothetical protein
MPSTVIAAIHYDKGILKIVFVSGTVYHYLDVPEEVYMAMKASKSKGIYFNQHIKDKYAFEKIN